MQFIFDDMVSRTAEILGKATGEDDGLSQVMERIKEQQRGLRGHAMI